MLTQRSPAFCMAFPKVCRGLVIVARSLNFFVAGSAQQLQRAVKVLGQQVTHGIKLQAEGLGEAVRRQVGHCPSEPEGLLHLQLAKKSLREMPLILLFSWAMLSP